jgi:hypothetical protein
LGSALPLTKQMSPVRKVIAHPFQSFSPQSLKGSRFVETQMAVIETCRQRFRNVFQLPQYRVPPESF